MDEFLQRMLEYAPLVAILMLLVYRLMKQNEQIICLLVDCYKDSVNRVDDHEGVNGA